MASDTIVDLKKSFLLNQLRTLSTPLAPGADWQDRAPESEDGALKERMVGEALYRLNQTLRQHNKAAYSSQAVRHVAEQLDALYMADTEPGRGNDLGEALDRGQDLTLDKNLETLPDTWPDDDVTEGRVEEAIRYQELYQQLMELSQRRQEAKKKLVQYKALQSLLEPYRNPRENIQPNLVTRDGELGKELERMRMLMARVGGRIAELKGPARGLEEAEASSEKKLEDLMTL